jgi:hypothetical protein
VEEDQYSDIGGGRRAYVGGFSMATRGRPAFRVSGHRGGDAIAIPTIPPARATPCSRLADFDRDSDLDVVLGTKTAANAGKLEFWSNVGINVFTQRRVVTRGE